MISLVFDEQFHRIRHTDKFPEHIDAVMYKETLDHKVHFGEAHRVQVERALCHSVRAIAALVD